VKWLIALLCTASVTLIARTSPQQPDSASPVPQPPAPSGPSSEQAARPSFAEWLDGVRAEAVARGIRQEIVDEALMGIEEPVPIVLERDRSQAETVLSIETYLDRQVTAKRIATGRQMVAKYRATLNKVSDTYGVPVRIIAGIWGMESNFGQFSGVRPTVAALATLAWDPRRSTLFRGELFNALQILDRGDIDLAHMKGSWAGAMGQPQFMPSSFLQFAEDFDGDGRRDIWSSPDDVFASIANYLKGNGWVAGQAWGREVSVTDAVARRVAGSVARRTGGCQATRDMTVLLPLSEWRQMGVRTLGGSALPNSEQAAGMVSGARRHFLVYGNYDALLQYNCAHSYALSVALLGDRIESATAPAPAAKPATPAKGSSPHAVNGHGTLK
jgi:membrane-bound lytic murein transglycosylase B